MKIYTTLLDLEHVQSSRDTVIECHLAMSLLSPGPGVPAKQWEVGLGG